jgi:hypothetical protein
MKKRFVVLVGETPNEAETKFKDWVGAEKLGWWHWMPGSWLIVDTSGAKTASELRDAIGKCYGASNSLILELRGKDDTWSGFGPQAKDHNFFQWIRTNWKGE